MKKIKRAQIVFTCILLAAWLGYAALNAWANIPALKAGYQRGWDALSRVQSMEEAASGSFLYHEILQDVVGYQNELTAQGSVQVENGFSIIRSDNGYLHFSNYFPYESYHFRPQALQLREVQAAAQKWGGSLLFVNLPDLYVNGLTESDMSISNLNSRSDALLYALQGYGVPYMDARKVLEASELPISEYRYKTEPHWTTQAGFEVYLALLDWMDGQRPFADTDAFLPTRDSFKQTRFSDAFSGQMGQRVGIPYGGYDDFVLIEPNFGTNFTLSYHEKDWHEPIRGDFGTVLLNRYWMDSENPYARNMYNTYLTGLYGFRQIKNNLNPGGPKVLVIGDSHILPMATFLATAAREVHLMWPYSMPDMGDNSKTLVDYVNANNFDHIIIGMNPGSMAEGGFNFLSGVEVPDAN